MNSKVEISLSKTKITGLLVGSIIIVILGILCISIPEKFVSPIIRSPEVIRISGIASAVFFGLCLVFIARKLFDNKPGLIIDQYGITNNTNAMSMGLIEWDDITGIEKKQVVSTTFLILHTDNPEKYINRAKNVISKKAMSMNYKTYGSPISITSNSLKINFDDLEKLLRSEFEEKKKHFI